MTPAWHEDTERLLRYRIKNIYAGDTFAHGNIIVERIHAAGYILHTPTSSRQIGQGTGEVTRREIARVQARVFAALVAVEEVA